MNGQFAPGKAASSDSNSVHSLDIFAWHGFVRRLQAFERFPM